MHRKINVDPDEVEKLAAMHCTMKEIASFVDCSVDTLERKFADVIAKGKEKGKAKLRRLQWQSAEKGNVVMQIWLGKQYLDQREPRAEDETTGAEYRTAAVEQLRLAAMSKE